MKRLLLKSPDSPASSVSGLCALTLSGALLFAIQSAQAATIDWNGSTSAWATGTNWTGNTAPTNNLTTDIARFDKTTYTAQPTAPSLQQIAGIISGDGTTATAALTISTGGTTNRLGIGASGIVMNANSGAVTIGAATTSTTTGVLLGASQSWTNNSSSLLTVSAVSNIADVTPFTLTLGGSGSGGITITAVVSDGGTTGTTALIINTSGSGVTTLTGTNTFTGSLTLTSGTLSVGTISNGGTASNLGKATSVATNLVFDGGTLQYTGATVTSNRNFTINAGKTATIDVTTNVLTLSGASTATTGALTKIGNGTLILTGANTYTGLTTVSAGELDLNKSSGQSIAGDLTVNGGTAKLLAASQINTASSLVVSGGTFDIQSFNQTLAGVRLTSGNISGTTGVLTSTGAYDMRAGTVSAKIGGSVALNKTTSGTVTLSGANTYTGLTTVSAGTLLVDGAHTTAGAYSVSSGGTLGGTGSITTVGNVGVTFADGSALSPGDNSAATLSLTLGTGVFDISAMNTVSKLSFSLGTSSDKVSLTSGILSIGTLNSSEFAFTQGAGFGTGTYTLFDTSSSISATALDTVAFSLGGGFVGQLQYANSSQDIQLLVTTSIPEPSTYAAFLSACVFGFAACRRRRASLPN